MSRRTLVALLLCLFARPVGAFIDYPYAVTFQTIRVPMMPLYEVSPGQGHWAVRTSGRWINVWSYQLSRFIVDGEEFQIEPSARYGITDHVQLGGSVPVKSQGGGSLDGTIQAFHRAVNVTQGHRDAYPRNTFNVSYEPLGAYYGLVDQDPLKTFARQSVTRLYPRTHVDPPVRLPGFDQPGRPASETIVGAARSQAGAFDPRFFLQWEAHGSNTYGLVLGAQVKVAGAGGSLFSSPGTDVGVFGALRYSLAPTWVAHGGAAVTRGSVTSFQGIRLPRYSAVMRSSLEYMMGSWTLFFEYVYFTPPTIKFGELSKPGHEVGFGVHYDWPDGFAGWPAARLTAGAVENFLNFGVTPDIGFLFSFEVRG